MRRLVPRPICTGTGGNLLGEVGGGGEMADPVEGLSRGGRACHELPTFLSAVSMTRSEGKAVWEGPLFVPPGVDSCCYKGIDLEVR